jgi:hypothetical protein
VTNPAFQELAGIANERFMKDALGIAHTEPSRQGAYRQFAEEPSR